MYRNQQYVSLSVAGLSLIASLMFVSCRPSAPDQSQVTSTKNAHASLATNAAAHRSSVELQIKSWPKIEEQILTHQGKVVVVDFWSTWCITCMREFPNLVDLQNTYGDRVHCISVCLDYDGFAEEPPESKRENIETFLKKVDGTTQNFLSSTKDLDVYQAIKIGAVPAVFVYDERGQLHSRFTDNTENETGEKGFTYQTHVTPLVEKLLGRSAQTTVPES